MCVCVCVVCVEYIFVFCFKPDQIFLDPIIYPFLYHFFCKQKLCIMMMMMIMIPKTIFFLRKFLNKKKIFSLFDLDIYLVYMAIIIIVIITIVCVCVCRIFIFFSIKWWSWRWRRHLLTFEFFVTLNGWIFFHLKHDCNTIEI